MLGDTLTTIISKLTEDMLLGYDSDTDSEIIKPGIFDMGPYQAALSGAESYVGKDYLNIVMKCYPLFIKDEYPDTSFCYENVGTSKTMPFVLSHLEGNTALSISGLRFRAIGDVTLDNQMIPGGDIEYGGDEHGVLNLEFIHHCDRDLTVTEIIKPHSKPILACSYWTEDRLDVYPLIPFGVFWDQTKDLDACVPLLGVLKAGQTTKLGVQPYAFWQRYGLTKTSQATIEDKVYDLPQDLYDPRSIGERIRNGDLEVSYNDTCYRSKGYRVINSDDNTVEILFQSSL